MKLTLVCDLCNAKGLIWLGGKDYLECPQCNGTKKFVMFENRITPARHILVPGQRDVQPTKLIV